MDIRIIDIIMVLNIISLIFSVLIPINHIFGTTENYTYSYFSNSNFNPHNSNNSSSGQEKRTLYENANSTEKVVIIIFDRGYETQFTNAKPNLDKYGFKASFFIICSFIDNNSYYMRSDAKEKLKDRDYPMDWDQIKTLYKEGHDIESHGMEHRYLGNLSSPELEYEVSGSKECLESQDLNPTYFQNPFNKGAENVTILRTVSKYFDFGLSGHSTLMFLNCDGWVNHGFKTKSNNNQYDCNHYSDKGIPTRSHKYAIREWSHDISHLKLNKKYPNLTPHGDEISNMLFSEFVSLVESQKFYNEKAEKIVAIPIIGYHSINNSNNKDTSENLFHREMKYLYDNGFKILRLSDLGYDERENDFYIK